MPAKTEDDSLRRVIGIFAALVFSQHIAAALPQGEGESLVREHCSSCHRPEILERAQGYDTAVEWRQLMATMIEFDEPRAALIAAISLSIFNPSQNVTPN